MANSEELSGMTVNERLFVLGLIDDFDRASEKRDEAALRNILSRTEIGHESIEAIVHSILDKG